MNSVFGGLHHLRMRLQQDKKSEKISDKKLSVFTAGSIFRPISRVMGVINVIGFRWFASFTDALAARLKSEKSATKSFPFLLLAAYFGPYLGHGCDK